ncbi:MAG TPA: phosphonate metabolism transcriptional regulator PhnF [Xanthobacteraceae bacterium]|jgi:GntR family phosphonate transport system transcriptional regulator|nr:phosphonate metabolism transcriptional regulator PhnF [Xanthobacteraceae bacterium]
MRPLRREASELAPGVTLWRRIADEIEQAIALGTHKAGARLPGEVDIAAQFGVNRHTVRHALAELARRGLVRATRGSGTYVEPARLTYPIRARTRFSEIVGSAGRDPGGRLIGHGIEAATPDIARRLDLKAGDSVVRLDILRSADGLPLCSTTSWLPAKYAPDAARVFRARRSITATLAHFGIRDYRRQSTHITAGAADAVDADRLQLSPGRAILIVDSINVTVSGTPVLTNRSRFAADRVELVVES